MEFQFLEEAESQTSPQQNAGGLQFEYIQGAQEVNVEPSGFLRQAADLPIQFAKGGLQGTRMFTDLLGAGNPISKKIAGGEEYLDALLSAESKKDSEESARILKAAEDKGVYDQVVAGLEALSKAPLETAFNVAGMAVPNLALGALGKAAQAGKAAITATQVGLGALQGAGSIKGQIYQAVQDELRSQGMDEEAIHKTASEAQAYGGKNLDQILLGAGLGAAATRAEVILSRVISGAGKEVTDDVIKNTFKNGLFEAIPEAFQGGQEQIAQNKALQNIGVDVPTMRGVVSASTMEGVAGGAFGGVAGFTESMSATPESISTRRNASPGAKAEAEIDRDSDIEAVKLSTPANDTNKNLILDRVQQARQGIVNLQESLDVLEPTDPKAQGLRLDISAKQKELASLEAMAGLSEPITTIEEQQAELAKSIVEQAKPTETKKDDYLKNSATAVIYELTSPEIGEALDLDEIELALDNVDRQQTKGKEIDWARDRFWLPNLSQSVVTQAKDLLSTPEGRQALRERITSKRQESAAPNPAAAPAEPTIKESLTVQPAQAAPAPVEQVVTPPVEVAPAPVIEEEPMSVSDEKEFAELNDLMERKGQAENKVRGVKFTKQDQSRYQNLLTKFRDRLIETTDPKNDPVVGTDINGTPIQQSNKGTFYTFENGRVRTGPAFSEATPAPVTEQPIEAKPQRYVLQQIGATSGEWRTIQILPNKEAADAEQAKLPEGATGWRIIPETPVTEQAAPAEEVAQPDIARSLTIEQEFNLSPVDAALFNLGITEAEKNLSKYSNPAEALSKEAMRFAVKSNASLLKVGDIKLAKRIAQRFEIGTQPAAEPTISEIPQTSEMIGAETTQPAPAEAPAPEVAPVEQTTESLGLKYTETVSRMLGWEKTAQDFVDIYGSGGAQIVENAAAYVILRSAEQVGFISPSMVKRAKDIRKILRKQGYKVTDPTKPTPAVSETITEPAAAPTPAAQEDVKARRYAKILGDNAPQIIQEAKNSLASFKRTMSGRSGDDPFTSEPRLRELKNILLNLVAIRFNNSDKNAGIIAEQIILGQPNIVDKATELKPIKKKEFDSVGASPSSIMRYGYEKQDGGIYRHPREGEAKPKLGEKGGVLIPTKEDVRYNPLGYDIADVVEDIKQGKTSTPLKAVNQVIKESTDLRKRVAAESTRRQQPRKMGKAAILERIARERSAGNINENTAKALTDFINRVNDDAIWDTAISIRAKGVSNYDFADNLVTFFLNQDKGDFGASVGIHEFWHGLSRFLPDAEVEKINNDYTKELADYLKKNPWFLAFVGRYSLTPEQFEAYKKFNPKEAETKLTPVKDEQGNIVKYKIKFDKDNYRYIMLDEFIAEKMTDLVLGKQQEPNTFLGKLAKVLREFMALIKARLGVNPYEKFYQAVTSTNGKLVLQRETGVAPAMQIYDPVEYDYSTRKMGADLKSITPRTPEEVAAFEKASSNKVMARNPELAVAAVRLNNGEITAGEYADLIDALNPFTVKGAESIPTKSKIDQYIDEGKKDKVNAPIESGKEVEFRIDIPTYNRSTAAGDTVYAVTAHEPVPETSKRVGTPISYVGVAKVINPKMMTRSISGKGEAIDIATGSGKFPLATVKGNYEPITELPADINDPNVWTEVSYNPIRSSYFVDVRSKNAVVAGDEAIMVGSRVFVKNPKMEARPRGLIGPEKRYMAVESDKEQIKGEKIGPPKKTPEGIIAKTQELLRKQFDPSKVSDKNTTEAFRALGRLMGKGGTDFAKELNDIGRVVDKSGAASEISMGAALFVNDLFEYSIRLAAEGDSKMLGIMMANINRLPTAMIGASDAGRTLAARAELKARFSMMGRAEQDAYTNYVAEFIYGPNPTKEQVQSIKDAYAAVEKTPQVTEQELTDEIKAVGDRTGTDLVGKINEEFTKATEKGKEKRKTEEAELDEEYSKVQKQADAEIEKLAKIQSDTPSFDPAVRQVINEVRAIVANDLKQRPDMESKADWKSALVAKLQQVGVELTAAETLADIVWRQHEINNLSRELSSINKAIEKGPISEIVKAIKETPLEDQQNPNWRYEVMRDYLRKAGLNVAQSERIAKLMDISLQKRFTMAQEQAFTDAISKTAPWKSGDTRSRRAFQKVLQALRAGALDPARNVLSDMAALNGWTGFTPEQYKDLLKYDAILADPKTSKADLAEAHKAIQNIISKAKLPIRARDVIGQYYDAQALSGITTMTVNIFSPAGVAVKNALVQSLNGLVTARPDQITAAMTTFVDSIKSWANTVAYSFKNNVTVYSNVEYLVNDEGLLKLYNRGVDQFKGGKTPRERADGVKNMMIGMMDYVRRILNALDYGAIASLQNQAVSKYALAVMQAKGMSSKDGTKMLNAMMEQKRIFYTQQIAIGTDKNKAAVLADEFFISAWEDALTKEGVEKSEIKKAMDAALNDAMSAVGRNRQSLDAFLEEETNIRDEGLLSFPAIWLLETMANAANRQDNQFIKIFSRVIYGFAIVPARVLRETAWFSPIGAYRFAYEYIAEKKGLKSRYAQSLGNDLQYRQRLTETIAGSIVMLAFGAAMSASTDDEDDEKPFKIVVTGNGPLRNEDPQYYDSWVKKNRANTVSVYFGKTKFTLNTMRGFEAFAWPAMMLGAVDDWHIRRKQKRETNTPMQMQDAAIVAGNVLSASLRRGPYAFAAKPLFEAYGDRGVESLAKSLAFPAKTIIPVLGSSLASNLSNFLNEPIDRKTLEGALWANVPFIGPAVAPKSLNAFGEPAMANDAADKIFKLGVPIVFDIPADRDSVNLHELVLKQGGGPSIPTRNQLAQRLDRQPTNKEYEMFVKEYGAVLTKSMKKNYEKLSAMKPEAYTKVVERIGNRARDIAENKVRVAAKKP